MKTDIWIVTTTIPAPGESPCFPSPFATEAEAEGFTNEMMIAEWQEHGPEDDETGNRLPYPGDWREAQNMILGTFTDGSWGQWQVTQHTIETPDAPHPAAAFIDRMAQFTTPEDEFADPENRDNVAIYSDVDEYISDMSDDRLCGEYSTFMEMVREARTIRDAAPDAPGQAIHIFTHEFSESIESPHVEAFANIEDARKAMVNAAFERAEQCGIEGETHVTTEMDGDPVPRDEVPSDCDSLNIQWNDDGGVDCFRLETITIN